MKRTQYATAAFSLLTAVFFLTFGHITTAAPGDLDLTFSSDGMLKDFIAGGASDLGRDVAVQVDGKIVIVGTCSNPLNFDFCIARFGPNGDLDTSFDDDGIVTTSITTEDEAWAVALLPDGKIVVAGSSRSTSNWDFAVVRYNPDGSIDTSFDGDGKVLTPVGNSEDFAYAIAVQPDGKILVAGARYQAASLQRRFSIVRYNADGSLDNSFGENGRVATFVGSGIGQVQALALEPQGKIVAAGFANTNRNDDYCLVRYNADGSLDGSFGMKGIVLTDITDAPSIDRVWAITAGTEGKITAAGEAAPPGGTPDFALVRYNSDGSLDNSFETDGKVVTQVGAAGDIARSVAMANGGKIVAGGQCELGSAKAFCMVRYDPDGSLDATFDGDGKVITTVTPGGAELYKVMVQADGKILVGGLAFNTAHGADLAVARYDQIGTLDVSFHYDGKTYADIGFGPQELLGLALQQDGKIVGVGSKGSDFVLARYNPNGSHDLSFNGKGKAIVSFAGTDLGSDVAIQPDGKIVAVGSSSDGTRFSFAVTRLNANGTPDLTFGDNGKVIIPLGQDDAFASGIALQANGKIVIAGKITAGSDHDFAVVRLHGNGSLDESFNGNGVVITSFGTGIDTGTAVAIQADEKIVVAGMCRTGSNSDFGLVRYNADGSLDQTFDGDGKVITPVATGTGADFATSVVLQTDGKIVAAGGSFNGQDYDFAMVRYNLNGTLDTSFDGDGKALTPVGASGGINSVFIQQDEKIVAVGSGNTEANRDITVVRYATDGSLDGSYGTAGKKMFDLNGPHDHGYDIALDSLGRAVVAGSSGGQVALLRIHGDSPPPPLVLSVTGRVMTPTGRGIPNARVTFTDTNGVSRSAITKTFGHYYFENVTEGSSYTVSVTAKRYASAQPRSVSVKESVNNLNFVLVQ
jgi:uncharacterized delta-60 repeat protein